MAYDFTDHARLVADLEAGSEGAVAYAYAQVFAGQMGRLVLTHSLATAGGGQLRGPEMSPIARAYHDGAVDHALNLLTLAGHSRMGAAHAIAADLLTERTDHDGHDTAADHGHVGGGAGGWSGPDDLSPG